MNRPTSCPVSPIPRLARYCSLLWSALLASLCVPPARSEPASPTNPSAPAQESIYRVLTPETSTHLHESAHFVARWNDQDAVKLTAAEIDRGLQTLEEIRTFYLEKVGFPPPYENQAAKFKINVNLSNQGWASGSGTGHNDPAMWLHFDAFKDRETVAHEFAHCLQFGSLGLRDSPYVGWSWESHAEWMTYQMYPESTGSSDQLVNAPHLYYGSTRNRYGNWQFWEYIKDTFGYSAINQIWSLSRKPGEPGQAEEDPLLVLARNQGWQTTDLNDQFGLWALRNATWDYKNGAVYRKNYGSYEDRSGARRNRNTILDTVIASRGRYAVPDYRAPQRYGYNLVRIDPSPAVATAPDAPRIVSVDFRGLVQTKPGVTRFSGDFENEPDQVPSPASDWRWGLVAVNDQGTPRYSPLQRGASARLEFPLQASEHELWLVVTATPTEYARIRWDQPYYTLYRYPWMVEIQGGVPRGSAPGSLFKTEGRNGAPHRNGGGWVDATARVDATAFVGPDAMVLEEACVSGSARIEGQAIVSGRAIVQDQSKLSGRALVTGEARIAGRAHITEDATIRSGSISDAALVGALTIVDDPATRIRERAVVSAVMNTLPGVNLSGTVHLLGDVELHTSLSKGVFYGIVDAEMAKNPRFGALRTAPEPEVTSIPPVRPPSRQ